MAAYDEVTTLSESRPQEGDPRTLPYNRLPHLPPEVAVETLQTLKKAISANKALAELRTAGELIPNQALLIRAIVLQEAKLSSEIENIVTTNDELYRAFGHDPERTDPATKEVLRYQEALWHGYDRLEQGGLLTTRLFIEIASIIKEHDTGVRKMPGTRVANRRTGEPIYAPPEGEELLRRLLDNVSEYLYSEDGTDPLIKMAVAHYQFEAIHPFPDGNGRTGRVINILYLVAQKLLDVPVLYLSRFIIQNKGAYYEGLRRVTEEARWEEWVLFMLDAIEQTSRDTKRRIEAIRDAQAEAVALARTQMRRGYSRELVELVFSQPYIRIGMLLESKVAKRDAASEYLRELERIGLLRSEKYGRTRFYLNERLLRILAD